MIKKSSKTLRQEGLAGEDTADENYEEINPKKAVDLKREDISEVYINNEYDTSTMASLDNTDDDDDDDENEEEAEDEEESEDEEDDDEEEEEEEEKMVFSSSAGERMLISISGDRWVNCTAAGVKTAIGCTV